MSLMDSSEISTSLDKRSNLTKKTIDTYLITYCRALAESKAFCKMFKQPLPETITPEELLGFNMKEEFRVLKANCPFLFSVVSGAMGLGQRQAEV